MNSESFCTRRPGLFAAAMILLTCIGQAFMMSAPVFVGLFADQWHFSERQLAMVVNAEIAGNAVGAILVGFGLGRLPARTVAGVALVGMVLGNLYMGTAPGLGWSVVARAVSGVGAGMVAGLAMRSLALSDKAPKLLSIAVFVQTLFSVFLLSVVMPSVGSAKLALWVIMGASALCLPLALTFGRDTVLPEHHRNGVQPPARRLGAYLVLLSLFGLYGGVGVVWTFVERLGVSAHLSGEQIGTILGGGNLASLVPCLFIPWAVARGYRFSASIVSLLGCALGAAILALPITPLSYAFASVTFQVAWNAATILALVSLPLYDPVGRYITMAPCFFGFGSALGSSIAGELLESAATSTAFGSAALWCLLAVAFFVPLRWVAPAQPPQTATA